MSRSEIGCPARKRRPGAATAVYSPLMAIQAARPPRSGLVQDLNAWLSLRAVIYLLTESCDCAAEWAAKSNSGRDATHLPGLAAAEPAARLQPFIT